jgi:AcrR family transcriptional regulator
MPSKSRSKLTQPAEGGDRQWSDTEISILEAARHIIADDGYHKFSLRATAARAGMHLKSLQYYFPTKKQLLIDVVNYTIENYYFHPYQVLFAKLGVQTSEEKFRVMIEYLLDDLKQPFTARLFPELWALASHDPEVAEVLDIFYLRHLASIEEMIRSIEPGLPISGVSHRAAIIGMLIEGLLLIMGHGKPKHPQYEGLRASVTDTICDIAGFSRNGMSPASQEGGEVSGSRTV